MATNTVGVPRTALAATNVILYAIPWQSYLVELRSTPQPSDAWTIYRRVPLTDHFQIIAPASAGGLQFRARAFTADPFALELPPVSGMGVQPVLYGPIGEVFELLAVQDLIPPGAWAPIETIAMTNTFRILPLEPLTTPRRFFDVRRP